MPFVLILIGTLMLVTSVQGTQAQFATQLARDGQGFIKYGIAVGVVGAAGYVSDLQTISRLFMALILVSLVLSNSKSGVGLIGNFQNAINGIAK